MNESRTLKASFQGNVKVHRQVGPHEVRRVPVKCLIGVSLDIDLLLDKLGEKALKSKGRRATAFGGALVLAAKELDQVNLDEAGQ